MQLHPVAMRCVHGGFSGLALGPIIYLGWNETRAQPSTYHRVNALSPPFLIESFALGAGLVAWAPRLAQAGHLTARQAGRALHTLSNTSLREKS